MVGDRWTQTSSLVSKVDILVLTGSTKPEAVARFSVSGQQGSAAIEEVIELI
jgi:hypothetical protein